MTADPDLFTLGGACRHPWQPCLRRAGLEMNLAYTGMVALTMLGQRGNLYIEFTPEGLRQLAANAIDAADRAQALGSAYAANQLAATLAKRGDPQ
jgi:hypothetical protein